MLYNKIIQELNKIQEEIIKLNSQEAALKNICSLLIEEKDLRDEKKMEEIKTKRAQLLKKQTIYREFGLILEFLYNNIKDIHQIYYPEYLPCSPKVKSNINPIYLLCSEYSLYTELININSIYHLSYYSYDFNERPNNNANLKLSNNKEIFDFAFDIPTISFKREVFFYENFNNKDELYPLIIDFISKNDLIKLIKIDNFLKENINLINKELYNLSISLFDLINT